MTVRYFLKYHYLRESLYNEILDLLYQACWAVDDLIDCCGFSKERGKIEVDITRLDKEEIEELVDKTRSLYNKIDDKYKQLEDKLDKGILRGILAEAMYYLDRYLDVLDYYLSALDCEAEEVEEPTDYSEEMGELVSIFDEIFRGLHEHKNWRVALPSFN